MTRSPKSRSPITRAQPTRARTTTRTRMRRRGALAAVTAFALAGALAGCGQSGSPDAPAPAAGASGSSSGSAAASAAPSPTYQAQADVSLADSPTFQKIKQNGKIRIGVKYDQPGLGLKDAATGEYRGFDNEIAKMISASLGLKPDQIEWVDTVSANREPFLQQGQVDMVVATYTINDKRKKVVSFAGPYYQAGQDLLVKQDNTDITGPDSLSGKTVCSVDGSTPAQRIRDKYADAKLITFDTYSKCVQALASGQTDAVTTDDIILRGYAAQQPGMFKVVGKPFSEEPYGIGLPKTDTAMKQAVNDALKKREDAGDWKAAFDYTFGSAAGEVSPPPIDTAS